MRNRILVAALSIGCLFAALACSGGGDSDSSGADASPPIGTAEAGASADGGRTSKPKTDAGPTPIPDGGHATGPDSGTSCGAVEVTNDQSGTSCTIGFKCVNIQPRIDVMRDVACDRTTSTCTAEDGTVTTFAPRGSVRSSATRRSI